MAGFCTKCTALVSDPSPSGLCGKCRDSMDNEEETPDTVAGAQVPRMITIVPFEGFYETLSGERIDEAAGVSESDYEYWSEENPKAEGESEDAYRQRRDAHFDKLTDETDFDAIRNEFCKMYVERFAQDNNIKLEFEKLESPRYYNFTTDRIFAYITKEEVQRLVSIVDRKALAALIEEEFTSRDGFSSFYSNDIDQWNIDNVEGLDHNQIGTIIECITGPHIEEESKNYPYALTLMEDFYR